MTQLDDREIYPNAPLEFVACEVRFPLSPALGEDGILPRLHRSFYDWLPLVEPAVETMLLMSPGNVPPPTTTKQLRFLARDRRFGVLVTPTLVSVETTRYTRYEEFRESIARSLSALEKAEAGVAGLARIGLRYIDEVRVPRAESDPQVWTAYIDQRLASGVTLLLENHGPASLQGTLQYDLGDGQHVVMRYGALRGQSVGNAPLRRREIGQPGAYFLVDIDSYWTPDDPLPEFSVDDALDICDRLHRPVRELFEASINERLRDEVLRRVPDDN